MRWVWSRLWSFDAREGDHGGWIAPRGVELWSDVLMCKGNKIAELDAPKLLAPLDVGDQLPWHLGLDGSPHWLMVIEVIGPSSYRVRYPDGTTGVLVDSE